MVYEVTKGIELMKLQYQSQKQSQAHVLNIQKVQTNEEYIPKCWAIMHTIIPEEMRPAPYIIVIVVVPRHYPVLSCINPTKKRVIETEISDLDGVFCFFD